VRVVDDGEHRPVLAGLGEEAERGDEDQEPVAGAALGLSERRAQGVRLRLGQPVGTGHHRAQQPLEGGEGEGRLRLHPLGAQHRHVVGNRCGVVEQDGLAHARQAPHDQGPAAAGPRVVAQRRERRPLPLSSLQHAGEPRTGPAGSRLPWVCDLGQRASTVNGTVSTVPSARRN
jgi:hypothetical protein